MIKEFSMFMKYGVVPLLTGGVLYLIAVSSLDPAFMVALSYLIGTFYEKVKNA